MAALCRDIAARGAECRDDTVDTVYFGGGTPTILQPVLLLRVLETLRTHYRIAPTAEITIECNPATGSREGFAELRRGGFNRISIGLQSTHENELRALGRLHSFSDFCKTYDDVRAAGFENVSLDLMSGIPEQTLASWQTTLERAVSLSPEHISAYGLIVEEGTPFYRMQERLRLPDEECARSMYFEGVALLEAAGYRQYEISNFAKCGYESRHNLKYWDCQPYLGFGPAAYSDFGGVRFGNSREVADYIAGRPILEETEAPSKTARINEYVMLRMRLLEGVSKAAFESRFGEDFDALFGDRFEKYVPLGLVEQDRDRIAFTKEGLYVSNAVLSELLDFSD